MERSAKVLDHKGLHHIRLGAQKYLGVLAALLFLMAAASPLDASSEKNVLHFAGDRAIFDPRNSSAEYIGNVKVTQGAVVIRTDNLKVFLRKDEAISMTGTATDEAIDKLVATGHVTIDLEGGTAVSEHAEYSAETRLLILSGSGTKFTQGKNTISGATITYDRSNGKVTVDGPVEAVIFSEDKL